MFSSAAKFHRTNANVFGWTAIWMFVMLSKVSVEFLFGALVFLMVDFSLILDWKPSKIFGYITKSIVNTYRSGVKFVCSNFLWRPNWGNTGKRMLNWKCQNTCHSNAFCTLMNGHLNVGSAITGEWNVLKPRNFNLKIKWIACLGSKQYVSWEYTWKSTWFIRKYVS